MENKPFVFGVATSGDNFTDRKKETARLLSNFRHGVNTVLISPRRWGKTSLVRKVCRLAQSDTLKVVYLDIFSCRSEREFYDAFASAVLKQTSSKLEEWMENARLFLSRISPKISLGTEPMTDFSISLELNPKADDVDDILQLPEKIAQKKGIDVVVCIDEFQQIAEFKDSKAFQKRLRSVWQLQKSVSYCLFGSKKHLMNELLRKEPSFYKFGDTVYLPKIGTEDWVDYICGRFEATGKHISAELAGKICRAVDNHSSYVQQLAWLVWIHTDETATEQDFEGAYQDIIDQNYAAVRKADREPHCISDEFFAGRTGGCAQGIHYACRFAEVQIGLVGQCEHRKTGIIEERTYRDGKTSGRHSGSGDGGMVEVGTGFVMPNWGRRVLYTVR